MTRFKYYGPKMVEYVLRRRTVRFSPPTVLNDPFDCLPIFTATAKDLKDFRSPRTVDAGLEIAERLRNKGEWKSARATKTKMRRSLDEFRRVWRQILSTPDGPRWFVHVRIQELVEELGHPPFGVLSMCANPVHPLMWVHYADNHSGFAVELDLDLKFREVAYRTERLRQRISKNYTEPVFLTKSIEWAYEEESRAFTDPDHPDLEIRGDLVLLRFRPEQLKSVTIGHRMELRKREQICRHLPETTALFEARPEPRRYAVRRVACNKGGPAWKHVRSM